MGRHASPHLSLARKTCGPELKFKKRFRWVGSDGKAYKVKFGRCEMEIKFAAIFFQRRRIFPLNRRNDQSFFTACFNFFRLEGVSSIFSLVLNKEEKIKKRRKEKMKKRKKRKKSRRGQRRGETKKKKRKKNPVENHHRYFNGKH